MKKSSAWEHRYLRLCLYLASQHHQFKGRPRGKTRVGTGCSRRKIFGPTNQSGKLFGSLVEFGCCLQGQITLNSRLVSGTFCHLFYLGTHSLRYKRQFYKRQFLRLVKNVETLRDMTSWLSENWSHASLMC